MTVKTTYRVYSTSLYTRIDRTRWTYDQTGKVIGLQELDCVYVHSSEYRK